MATLPFMGSNTLSALELIYRDEPAEALQLEWAAHLCSCAAATPKAVCTPCNSELHAKIGGTSTRVGCIWTQLLPPTRALPP